MFFLPLGVGGGFTKKYFHSNLIVELSNKRILVDAGTTLRYSLEKAKIKPETIDFIFITHFHHDHVGGIAEFLSACYWNFEDAVHKPHRPTLLLRPNQANEIEGLLGPSLNNQGRTWQDYCNPRVLVNHSFSIPDSGKLEIIPTDNLHCDGLNSCGIKFYSCCGKNVIVTSDIKKLADSKIISYIDDQTVGIIQDVSFKQNEVHASYQEVLSYYPKHLYEKIYGIHYEDAVDINKDYSIKLLTQGEWLVGGL